MPPACFGTFQFFLSPDRTTGLKSSTRMLTEKEQTFLNCRCTGCKRPFDFVPIDADACPFCRSPIDATATWQTRKYPGIVMLPGWVRAFGWPFLLMLAAPAIFLYEYYGSHVFEPRLPGLLFAIGTIFFFVKLNTNGDY